MNASITKKSDLVEKPVMTESIEKLGATATPITVLSTTDTAVSDLVREQRKPEELERLAVKDGTKFDLLALPEECLPLHGKAYRFRWLAKSKNLEARLRSGIWQLCTRANSPFIKPHRFKSHGAVEQAGMLLAFTTEKAARIRELEPARKSAALVKHYTEELPRDEGRGFYRPKSSDSEEDEKGEDTGLEEGRDF